MFLRCKEEPARNVEKREKKFSRRTGTGLELFSGRWTIFQVSDYVSWPQLRLITARAELVSFIGARARWMERYRHFERIEIGRRSISSWISAEEKEEGPLVRLSRTDCVSSLSPIARISCQSTRRLVSGFSYCDNSALLADRALANKP